MKTTLFLAACAATALPWPVSAQLEPASEPISLGPMGGSAIEIAIHPEDPGEILVTSYSSALDQLAVFRSTDGGATFGSQPYGTGYSEGPRHLVLDNADADTLYGVDGNLVVESNDFGATWNPISPVALYNDYNDLAQAPTGDGLLAIDAFNAYHSPDGGATWNTVLQVVPFSGAVLDAVVYSQSDPSVAYIAHSRGLYRSDDGGQTFADTGPFDTWVCGLVTSETDPFTVFAGTSFDGLFVSTDGGVTVQSLTPQGNAQWMASEPGGLWYGTLQELYFSDDEGATWELVIDGLHELTPIPVTLSVDADGVRYLGTESNSLFGDQVGGGLYRLPAGPVSSWDHIGFLATRVHDVALVEPGGERVIAIGNGIYSGDPGEGMTATSLFLFDQREVEIDPDDSSRWVAGGVGSFIDNAQLHVLSDGGDSWTRTYENFGAGVIEALEYDPHDSDRLLAGIFPAAFGNEAILRSDDDGASWIEVPGTVGWANRAIAFDPHDPGRVLQLSNNNQWAGSLDGGRTWSALQPPWPGTFQACLLEYDLYTPGVLYRGEIGQGLWRSDDGGATWTNLGVGLNQDSTVYQHPEFPDLMWVSDDAGHVLVSTDRGDSFQVALDVPQDVDATKLVLDTADGTLLVGTTAASTWEYANASPGVKLGDGTTGSGGLVPRLYPVGLPQLGNADFALGADRMLGGAQVYLALGLCETALPAYGGTFYVDQIVILPSFLVGGAAGVAGEGSFVAPVPVPNDAVLDGFSLTTQVVVVGDAGSSHLGGRVLSDGLRFTFHQ